MRKSVRSISQDDSYVRYLDSLTSQQKTPNKIIEDVVRNGIGKNLVSKKRIIAGEVNEVYKLMLNDKSQVILRISPNESPYFQQEKWAIKKSKNAGVPVPEILSISYRFLNGKEYAFCITKKIDGEPLGRGRISFGDLDKIQQKDYMSQAGNILAKIHSVSTSGVGRINNEGKGEFADSKSLILDILEKEEQYKKMAKEIGMNLSIIKKAMNRVENFENMYSRVKPRLVHGDFFRKHILVKDGKVTGILDWGESRSNSPIYDFANWDFWIEEVNLLDWLKEGYTNKELFDSNFDYSLNSFEIMIGLDVIEWYYLQKYKERVELVKQRLMKSINYFN